MGVPPVDLNAPGGGGGGGSAIGQSFLIGPGQFATLVRTAGIPTIGGFTSGNLVLRTEDGRSIPFSGGQLIGGDGRLINVGDSGQILSGGRQLSAPELQALGLSFAPPPAGRAASAGPAFASTQAGAQFARETDLEVLEQQHQNRIDELQIAARIARRDGREADARRFEQELKLLRERMAFDKAEGARERTFQERLGLLQQLTTLAQEAKQFQQGLTQQAVGMTGQDPLRAAINLAGGIQQGKTPAQALRGNILSLANQRLPQTNVNASNPNLRGQVGRLQDFISTPIVRPRFGLAHGGVVNTGGAAPIPLSQGEGQTKPLSLANEGIIEMQQGDDGAFAAAEGLPATGGTGKTGILVGEDADGSVGPGTEVLVTDPAKPGSIEIIPLRAAAQGGFDTEASNARLLGQVGRFGFGGAQGQGQGAFSNTPSFQALSPIFENIGITGGMPIARQGLPGTGGGLGLQLRLPGQKQLVNTPAFSTEAFSKLGVQPRLLRAGGQQFVVGADGEIFAVPQGLEGANMLAELGIDHRSFVDIGSFGELGEFAEQFGLRGEGGAFGFRQFAPDTLPLVEDFNSLSTISSPIIMPFGPPAGGPNQLGNVGSGSGAGLLLPAPETFAGRWHEMDPTQKELTLQAYELAGYPRGSVLSRIEGFTPGGTAQFGLQNAPAFA